VRVAAVDLGTNSTRLLVADVDGGSIEEEVTRLTKITRLGEGVDQRKRLLPAPIARVRNVLTDFRRTTEQLGVERTLVVATSAVRDADNGEAFLGEIEWSYGFKTRLLSGDEEAELSFSGVSQGRKVAEDTLVIDIGGGSTELVVGRPGELRYHDSLNMGGVRLTERFLHSDPPTTDELEACAAGARELLTERVPQDVRPKNAIGVAGTITSVAALDLGLAEYDPLQVDGHRISRDGVTAQLERLASVPLSERRKIPALDTDRAPVIVAGTVILGETLDHFGLDGLVASEHDILDGAALEAAKLPQPAPGDAPPGAYTCC
jgi:exopolyphosphatase / guanosine-5'-triphosphate,3'-diphosphate pyrophosphatase